MPIEACAEGVDPRMDAIAHVFLDSGARNSTVQRSQGGVLSVTGGESPAPRIEEAAQRSGRISRIGQWDGQIEDRPVIEALGIHCELSGIESLREIDAMFPALLGR